MARPAVFLDRDGVVIDDANLLVSDEQVRLCSGAAQSVRALREAGFAVVVVSNQTVVARGLASEHDVKLVQNRIQQLLRSVSDTEIDRFYFCPHHPSATVPQYRVACECRKPHPGMLLRAADELDLDLSASFLVGDRLSDIVAGARAGCRTILVETGMHTAPPIESEDGWATTAQPDHVCADLLAASRIILGAMR